MPILKPHQETIIDSKKSTSLEVKEIWNYRWMLMNLIKNNIPIITKF